MANLRHRCRRQQAASRTNPGLGVYCSSYEQSGDDLRPRHWRRRAKRLVNQPIPGPEFALDVRCIGRRTPLMRASCRRGGNSFRTFRYGRDRADRTTLCPPDPTSHYLPPAPHAPEADR